VSFRFFVVQKNPEKISEIFLIFRKQKTLIFQMLRPQVSRTGSSENVFHHSQYAM